MGEYKVFLGVRNKISKIIDIVVSILIIVSIISLFFFSRYFNILVIFTFIIFIVSFIFDRNTFNYLLNKPIIYDNLGNIFILFDGTIMLLSLFTIILLSLIIIFRLGDSSFIIFSFMLILIIVETGLLYKKFIINKINKSKNIVKLIKKSKGILRLLQVNIISKNIDNSYNMGLSNNSTFRLEVNKSYENYEELNRIIENRIYGVNINI